MNKTIILIIVLIISSTVFAVGNNIITNSTKKEKKHVKKETAIKKVISNSAIIGPPPEQDIVGTWVMEDSPSDKLVFTSSGIMQYLEDNVVTYTYNYEISYTYDGINYPSNDNIYLKTTDEYGEVAYDWIANIGPNPGDYLCIVNGPSSAGGKALYIKQ